MSNHNYSKFNMYGLWVGLYILSDMENQVTQSCLPLPPTSVPKAPYGPEPDSLILAGADKGVLVVQGDQSANAAGVSLERLQLDLFEVKHGVSLTQSYRGENNIRFIIQ